MTGALELVSVQKRFGDALAVHDVSFEIASGEYISVIGPSGCGKTTTLRMVSGFEDPTAGQIFIGGRDSTNEEPHRRNTAMVFQHFALFPHMTVAGNISFGLEMRGVPPSERDKAIREIMQAVDISDLAGRSVSQLSGGQQQRVGLARALVVRPDILLLDEPLGSLDANLRRRMIRVLRRLNKESGVAFMHVTHNQEEAFAVSDRVVIMNRGEIEQIGSPEEVARRPRNLFVAQFVGNNNVLAGTVVGGSGGMVELDTAVGTVSAPAPDRTPEHGELCHVVVRASRMKLCPEDSEADIVLEGAVGFTLMESSSIELAIDHPSGLSFKVECHEPDHTAPMANVGERVAFGWKAENSLVVFET